MSDNETGFVTRIEDNAAYEPVCQNEIEGYIHSDILGDKIKEVTVNDETTKRKLKLRKILFCYPELKREFEFLANLFEMRPDLGTVIFKFC
ncbi:MAG: hypothetical protein Q8908_12200 [Bacteroidota bacterium]|nr:hypothetical protein [Bacteroidota bacterium]